jgi:putative spermidine/putrescine transport system ATP-binding protein
LKAGTFKNFQISDLSRTYDKSIALSGLTLEIPKGEFIALLGPSGCGKSTALNCLAGLIPLTAGSIHLDDRRIDTLPPEKRDFGMVFQNYALFPHLTIRQNIAFGLKIKKIEKKEIETRVNKALELVQLVEHSEKSPHELSGGQQQRVAIARAIVLEPEVVLMDEPLSNLDAKLRIEMRGEIKKLHKTLGLTTIYVTHDQEEALSLADRLVVMFKGKVQQIGNPEEVFSNPINSFVADFMGYRNILPMEVARIKDSGVSGQIQLNSGAMNLISTNFKNVNQIDKVKVAIRPDDLKISNTGENLINGKVIAADYQGREYSLEVEVDSKTTLSVRSTIAAQIGSNLTLSVPTNRVLVFPDQND